MPHQSHKDVKGEPKPTEEDKRFHEERGGQRSGAANTAGQRAHGQQGARGHVDQASGPAAPNLQPETRKREGVPEPTARAEGDLGQTRVYEEDD